MIKKSVTVLDVYPSISRFSDKYCTQCQNHCEIPSLEMFACVLKKLNSKEKNTRMNELKKLRSSVDDKCRNSCKRG